MDPRVLQAAERVMAWARAQVVAGLAERPSLIPSPSDAAGPSGPAPDGAADTQARRGSTDSSTAARPARNAPHTRSAQQT